MKSSVQSKLLIPIQNIFIRKQTCGIQYATSCTLVSIVDRSVDVSGSRISSAKECNFLQRRQCHACSIHWLLFQNSRSNSMVCSYHACRFVTFFLLASGFSSVHQFLPIIVVALCHIRPDVSG